MISKFFGYILDRIDEFSFWVAWGLVVVMLLVPQGLGLFIVIGTMACLALLPDAKLSKTIRRILK